MGARQTWNTAGTWMDAAIASGEDPEHVAVFDDALDRMLAAEGRSTVSSARPELMHAKGFRVCAGCGEMIHLDALSCGACGWEP